MTRNKNARTKKKKETNEGPQDTITTTTTETTTARCHGCQQEFSSRNAVFKHLIDTNGACLPPQDYPDFCRYVLRQKDDEKVLILFGYIPSNPMDVPTTVTEDTESPKTVIRNGTDAANILLAVIQSLSTTMDDDTDNENQNGLIKDSKSNTPNGDHSSRPKYLRSYGHSARATSLVAQELDSGGAVTEVLATKLPPIQKTKVTVTTIADWMDVVNQELQQQSMEKWHGSAQIRVLGRQPMPHTNFNAELDLTHRRVEYLLPLDFLFPHDHNGKKNKKNDNEPQLPSHNPNPLDRTRPTPLSSWTDLSSFFQSFPSFQDGSLKFHATTDDETDKNEPKQSLSSSDEQPDTATLTYLFALKKTMQLVTTQIVALDPQDHVAVLEKEIHNKKRWRNKHSFQQQEKARSGTTSDATTTTGTNAETPPSEPSLCKPETTNEAMTTTGTNAETPPSEPSLCKPETATSDTIDSKGHSQLSESSSSSPSSHPTKKQRKETVEDNTSNSHHNKDPNVRDQRKRQNKKKKSKKKETKSTNVLRRRRYHNFTPSCMAHEYLSYRRLDRLYHRATLRFTDPPGPADSNPLVSTSSRPFMVLSMTGDLFLHGQAARVIGFVIALVRGVIDYDMVDCVFDESYPHLVPTPPAPIQGLYAIDAFYTSWEGKAKSILSARRCNRYSQGWNSEDTLQRVEEWQQVVRQEIGRRWNRGPPNGDDNAQENSLGHDKKDKTTVSRLALEEEWTRNILLPWATKARKQLEHYRQWKKTQQSHGIAINSAATSHENTSIMENGTENKQEQQDKNVPTAVGNTTLDVAAVDSTVPSLYRKVLDLLRQVDRSGKWPTTTPKRQLVMVSNLKTTQETTRDGRESAEPFDNPSNDSNTNGVLPAWTAIATATTVSHTTSLSMAHIRARANYKEEQSSAYDYAEGEGGASGSFSVGAMPGEQCRIQPKANELFPELMKAAFELEIALDLPNREPSSTIAINRNAQFRP